MTETHLYRSIAAVVTRGLPTEVPNKLKRLLENQKYHMVGTHSAVKRCRWLREALVNERPCYKQKFYGVKTHRCIQMTPAVHYCNMHCLFCWRAHSGDRPDFRWEETRVDAFDEPERIVDGCIRAQMKIVSGYKANDKTERWRFFEASRPRHVAISLTGEPTLYPLLGELIRVFHRRGFTTFLVSNGTLPEVLSKLSQEPTQLYVSLCAYNEEFFLKTCRPLFQGAWAKLNETLSLLPSCKCPTVLRMTLVRGLNMRHRELYARLIEKANPTYVEPKAYMHVGFSRLRLGFENMPSHTEVQDFAEALSKETGYSVIDESPDSRVVLLSRLEKAIRLA